VAGVWCAGVVVPARYLGKGGRKDERLKWYRHIIVRVIFEVMVAVHLFMYRGD
jgi:hypothetical protein